MTPLNVTSCWRLPPTDRPRVRKSVRFGDAEVLTVAADAEDVRKMRNQGRDLANGNAAMPWWTGSGINRTTDPLNTDEAVRQVPTPRSGDRGTGTIAHHAALSYITRDDTPRVWASRHRQLGVTLRILGEQENRTDVLRHAAASTDAALSAMSHTDRPQEWAWAQSELDLTYLALGTRESSTAHLLRAQSAFRHARCLRRLHASYFSDHVRANADLVDNLLAERFDAAR